MADKPSPFGELTIPQLPPKNEVSGATAALFKQARAAEVRSSDLPKKTGNLFTQFWNIFFGPAAAATPTQGAAHDVLKGNFGRNPDVMGLYGRSSAGFTVASTGTPAPALEGKVPLPPPNPYRQQHKVLNREGDGGHHQYKQKLGDHPQRDHKHQVMHHYHHHHHHM